MDADLRLAAAPSVTRAPAMRDRAATQNRFGVVRLILASAVILSHAFPLSLGQGVPDPLQASTGHVTIGDLAVNCFFVISGYLVSQSLARSRSVAGYLAKRIRRIYPGFAVAVLISLAIGLACGGAWRAESDLLPLALSLATLRQPVMTAAFAGNAYSVPNGSLWTIQYEFFCYLLPVAFLLVRLDDRRWVIAAASVALLLAADFNPRWAGLMLSPLYNLLRLTGMFLAGMALRLWIDPARLKPRHAAIAGALATAMMWSPVPNLLIGWAGGFALLTLCLLPGVSPFWRIGQRDDVSYGVYLYGWPVESAVIWLLPGIGPWAVTALAVPVALVAGWLSWRLVESPFLRWRLRR